MSDVKHDESMEVEGEGNSPVERMHPRVAALPADHLLCVLIQEHDVIRRWLRELESAVVSLEGVPEVARPERVRRVTDAVERMSKVDLHHRREELVVYPACHNVSLPDVAAALRGEHAEMNEKLVELTEEARALADSSDSGFDRILAAMRSFRFIYDNHMYKEDRVVFPLLADAIRDEEFWGRLRTEALNCGPLLGQDEG